METVNSDMIQEILRLQIRMEVISDRLASFALDPITVEAHKYCVLLLHEYNYLEALLFGEN
jgi:hypothetical protein